MYQLGTNLNKSAFSNLVQSQYSLWRRIFPNLFDFLIKYNFIPFSIRINQKLSGGITHNAYIMHSAVLMSAREDAKRCEPMQGLRAVREPRPNLLWHSTAFTAQEGGSQGLETLHVPWLSPEQQADPQPLMHWTSAHISVHYSILSDWIFTLFSLFDRRKCLCQ